MKNNRNIFTSTNLCMDTIMEAKTTLENKWLPKRSNFSYNH